MSNPRSISRGKSKMPAPRYPDDLERKIKRHLAAFLIHCQKMVSRTREIATKAGWHEPYKNQYEYWCTSVSVVRDILHNTFGKQRHLVDISDEQIDEALSWVKSTWAI